MCVLSFQEQARKKDLSAHCRLCFTWRLRPVTIQASMVSIGVWKEKPSRATLGKALTIASATWIYSSPALPVSHALRQTQINLSGLVISNILRPPVFLPVSWEVRRIFVVPDWA